MNKHKAAYWKRRFETGAMDMDRPVSVVPPHAGWKLICRRPFSGATKHYPRGSEVDAADLGQNWRAFMNAKPPFCEFVPPHVPTVTKAVDLPPPAPALKRPEVVIIADPDPVVSYQKTKAALVEKCGNNPQLADDLLMANRQTRDLYLVAEKANQHNTRQRHDTVCLPPTYRAL